MGLAALVVTYPANVQSIEGKTDQSFFEAKEDKDEKDLQGLANTLYGKMSDKGISLLFFESYGENNKSFYVQRNHESEDRYMSFNAEDHKTDDGGMKKVTIKIDRDLKNIESAVLKKYDDRGEIIKEKIISANNEDAGILYGIMLKTSVEYIDKAEINRGNLVNSATYKELIKDKKFVSALKNLR